MLIASADQMTAWSQDARSQGLRVGLVPTQGCLHTGHASLIEHAARDNDAVVVSVFVNPAQFRPEGYEGYPRSIDEDIELAAHAGAGVIFAPSVEEIYPSAGGALGVLGFTHREHPARDDQAFRSDPFPGALGDAYTRVPSSLVSKMDGPLHPWHFDGVATVVRRLHEIVRPHNAYYGLKDIQQLAIIRAMNDWLGKPTAVIPVPIARGDDGAALSSRLTTLSQSGRARAAAVAQAILSCGVGTTLGEIRSRISDIEGVELDDLSLVDPRTLDPIERTERTAVIYVAFFVEGTRLQECVIVEPHA